jgi:hypothetical protein
VVNDRCKHADEEGEGGADLLGSNSHNGVNAFLVFQHVPELSVIERWHGDETATALSIANIVVHSLNKRLEFFEAVNPQLLELGSEFDAFLHALGQ